MTRSAVFGACPTNHSPYQQKPPKTADDAYVLNPSTEGGLGVCRRMVLEQRKHLLLRVRNVHLRVDARLEPLAFEAEKGATFCNVARPGVRGARAINGRIYTCAISTTFTPALF